MDINRKDTEYSAFDSSDEDDGSEYLDGSDDTEDEREGDDDKRFTLNVDTLTGSHFQVFAYPSDTVDVVKARIAFQEGIGPYDQHLVWNNTELRDEKVLSDIGLCDGCTVKLVLALKGGPLETAHKSYIGNYIEDMIASLDNLFLNSTLTPLSPLNLSNEKPMKLPKLKKTKKGAVSKTEQRLLEELGEINESDSDESGVLSEMALRDPKSKFVILEENGRIFLIKLKCLDSPERDSSVGTVVDKATGNSDSDNSQKGSLRSYINNTSNLPRTAKSLLAEKSIGPRYSGRYGRKGENFGTNASALTMVNERIQENAATMEKVNLLKKRMLSARKKRKSRQIGSSTPILESVIPKEKVTVSVSAKNSKSSEVLRLPLLKRDTATAKTLKSGRSAFGYGTTIRKIPTQANLATTGFTNRSRQSTALSVSTAVNITRTPKTPINPRSTLSTATKSDRKSSRLSTPLKMANQIPTVTLETHLYNLNRVIADIFMQNRRNSTLKPSIGSPPYSPAQLAQYVRAKVNVLLCQQEQFYKNFPTVNEYRKTFGSNLNAKSSTRSNLLIPTVIFHRLFENDPSDGLENQETSPQSKSGRVTARMKIKSVRTINADANMIPLLELHKNQSRPSTNANGFRPKSSRSRPKTGSNQTIKKAPKNHIRCAHLECKKKLGLATRYQCRCGLTFCPSHRYPESHNCSFDFKEEGRRIISHDNPLVGPKKIDEI